MQSNLGCEVALEEVQASFIDRELLVLTLGATVQRSKLYREDLEESARRPFQQSLRDRLQGIGASRAQTETDEQHLANIVILADSLSELHGNVLNAGRMRLGHAQKALNLYLKYRWCLGLTPQPPHFPVDALILREIPEYRDGKTSWTQLDSQQAYLDIITAARRVAGRMTLAEWELRCYRWR